MRWLSFLSFEREGCDFLARTAEYRKLTSGLYRKFVRKEEGGVTPARDKENYTACPVPQVQIINISFVMFYNVCV